MDQFILFGDSLLQQAFSPPGTPFGPALINAYIRTLDIIPRGFSGYNTSQALSLLPHIIPHPSKTNVRFLLIFFGANDARLPNTPGGPQQHVPLELFRRNLREMATHASVRAHEGVRVILVSPPPVDERMLLAEDEEKYGTSMLRRTAETTAKYARAVREIGAELDLPVLDFHSEMLSRCAGDERGSNHVGHDAAAALPGKRDSPVNGRLQEYLRDGLHLSRDGYALLFESLLELVRRHWPDQMPEALPFVFPAWDSEEGFKLAGGVASL